jgi:hypothetical protein
MKTEESKPGAIDQMGEKAVSESVREGKLSPVLNALPRSKNLGKMCPYRKP